MDEATAFLEFLLYLAIVPLRKVKVKILETFSLLLVCDVFLNGSGVAQDDRTFVFSALG